MGYVQFKYGYLRAKAPPNAKRALSYENIDPRMQKWKIKVRQQ